MNRYTQLTATGYTPLSMQELAIAPAAMREKHDALTVGLEALRSKGDAYADPLSQHFNETKDLQNEMNRMIDESAGELSKKGYNSGTSNNVIKLNRQYQDLISPTGRLGQINAAKQKYIEERRAFFENSEKVGHSKEDAARNWNKHSSKYTGYDDIGNVSQIDMLGAPVKYEVMDFGKDIANQIGSIQRRLDQVGGGYVSQGPDGSYKVYNSSGSLHQDTNIQNLTAALNMAQSIFFTESGKGYKSAMFQGIPLSEVKTQLDSMIAAMLKDKVTDTRDRSVSLVAARNRNDVEDNGTVSLLESGAQSAPNVLTDKKLEDIKSTYDKLKTRASTKEGHANMSEQDLKDLKMYEDHINKVSNNLSTNIEYQNNLRSYNRMVDKEFKDSTMFKNGFDNSKLTVKYDPEKMNHAYSNKEWSSPDVGTYSHYYDGKKVSTSDYSKINKIMKSPEYKRMQEISNESSRNMSTQTTGRSYIGKNSKADNAIKADYNRNLDVLTIGENLQNYSNIISFTSEGSTANFKNSDQEKEEISKIKKAILTRDKDNTHVEHIKNPITGEEQVSITFTPKYDKDFSSYNVKGKGDNSKTAKVNASSPITVVLESKKNRGSVNSPMGELIATPGRYNINTTLPSVDSRGFEDMYDNTNVTNPVKSGVNLDNTLSRKITDFDYNTSIGETKQLLDNAAIKARRMYPSSTRGLSNSGIIEMIQSNNAYRNITLRELQ